MAEVTDAGEHHCDTACIGGSDDFGIANASPRLNGCCGSRLGSGNEPVREGEEGIAAYHASLE